MKKVCIVTGTRAEYGLLKPIIAKVNQSETMELQLVVTGMHLSAEFGLTYREIEEDGFPITAKIEMLLSSDTAAGITKSMGVAFIGFADYFEAHKPDVVILRGDRYEAFTASSAAMIAAVPIAHIHGGELTEGLIDEAIRHSITKMSQLHFTATQEYRRRVIQMGEQPESVYNVGALGVENIKAVPLLSKKELENAIHFKLDGPAVMVTYHPVTLENRSSEDAGKQFANILDVINKHQELNVIFTKANADTHGRIINNMIDGFVAQNGGRCAAFTSLGQLRYLSALQFCDAVIGNSSSGIIEVPSFGIPTVDIGNRQKGRACAASVIHCGNDTEEIEKALSVALSADFREQCRNQTNPYEGSRTSETIVKILESALTKGISVQKNFYDTEVNV